jgi:ABC-type uncharacterized transport system permease subunit
VIPASQWPIALGVQALWLVLFSLLSTFVWRAAARRVVVQGG